MVVYACMIDNVQYKYVISSDIFLIQGRRNWICKNVFSRSEVAREIP